MRSLTTLLTLTALVLPYGVWAQQAPKGPPPDPKTLIEQMDSNKDGKLERSEVKGPLLDDFDKIDLNEDGYLSLEELEKAPKPKGGPAQKDE